LLAVAGALLSPSLHAQSGQPDSYCPFPSWTGDRKLWRLSSDVTDTFNKWRADGTSISYLDTAITFDRALQNLTRWSRQRTRQRILVVPDNPDGCSTLDLNPDACIGSNQNDETPLCRDNPTALAWGGCDLFGVNCTVMLCEDNLAGGVDFGFGDFMTILMHEFGHALGLDHTDRFAPQRACATNPPVQCGLGEGWTCVENQCACTLDADCGENGVCEFSQCNYPNCAESDGCGGELMCSVKAFIRGPTISGGDSRGLRITSHGSSDYFNRRVFVERRPLGGQPLGFDLLEAPRRFSTFNPRIDCTFAPTFAQCVAIFTQMEDGEHATRVVRLADWNGTNFAINESRHRFTANHLFPPDIAADDGGDFAWIVYVSGSSNNTLIRRVNLRTGEAVVASLGYPSALPPRIVYSPVLDMALVLGAELTGSSVRWRLDSAAIGFPSNSLLPSFTGPNRPSGPINSNPDEVLTFLSSLRILKLDLGTMGDSVGEGGTYFPSADFDFDCLDSASTARTRCTVVAVLHDDGGGFVGLEQQSRKWRHVWSRQFYFEGGNTANLTSGWLASENDLAAQSVQGVARTAGKLLVSIGIQGDTQAANTRHLEFDGPDVSQKAFSSRHVADAESCEAPVDTGGFTMAGSTPWGGTSIDYCWSCGNGGRIISLNLGRRSDNDLVCF